MTPRGCDALTFTCRVYHIGGGVHPHRSCCPVTSSSHPSYRSEAGERTGRFVSMPVFPIVQTSLCDRIRGPFLIPRHEGYIVQNLQKVTFGWKAAHHSEETPWFHLSHLIPLRITGLNRRKACNSCLRPRRPKVVPYVLPRLTAGWSQNI